MAKDASGHGSNARGYADRTLGQGHNLSFGIAPGAQFNSVSHQLALAAQHGVPTEHMLPEQSPAHRLVADYRTNLELKGVKVGGRGR